MADSARRLYAAAHVVGVTGIALAATWAASLPHLVPAAGQAVCITAGSTAALLSGTWLPCPCHRKDHHS